MTQDIRAGAGSHLNQAKGVRPIIRIWRSLTFRRLTADAMAHQPKCDTRRPFVHALGLSVPRWLLLDRFFGPRLEHLFAMG